LNIPLHRGRFFNEHDDERAPAVAIVDEEFVHKFFSGENVIGKRVHMSHLDMGGDGKLFEIVGVVGHVNQWGLDSDFNQELRAQIYLSCLQMPDDYISGVPGGGGTMLAIRSALPTEQLVDALRRTSREINSDQAIYNVQTMDGVISASLAARRFSMILLASFAGLALLLSSIGIYGVISYVVGQKTREIGLRMALGASRSAVLRMILSQGGKLAAAGVIIGLGASFVLTRSMEAMLFGVSASDPFTFVAVATLLTAVALAACYIPARRAMRVDPMVALRHE
jgi:predicted permease